MLLVLQDRLMQSHQLALLLGGGGGGSILCVQDKLPWPKKKTATWIMNKIRTLFLSYHGLSKNQAGLRFGGAMREFARRAWPAVPPCQSHDIA